MLRPERLDRLQARRRATTLIPFEFPSAVLSARES
jgi:hypothetical protein